jgi:ABC-type microcin C transport system duplicated ATPase subunit YejF
MTILSADALLEVRGLQTWFPIRSGVLRRVRGQVRAVDGVDLTIYPGETLALVGESGCGKTTVGRTILRLIEPTAGSIRLEGQELSSLSKAQLRPLRQRMQIIFQDPFSSLNPRMRAGDIVAEPLKLHADDGKRARRERVAAPRWTTIRTSFPAGSASASAWRVHSPSIRA